MPIYTKKGDTGTTSLPYDARKRSKKSPRVAALGDIDELNSAIGAIIAFDAKKIAGKLLTRVQHDLFRAQMDIASKGKIFEEKRITPITEKNVIWLEKTIDELDKKLPHLHKFILPGGSKAGALAHLARAVCRRAERSVVALKEKEAVRTDLVKYLNRLSDFLFIIARHINYKEKSKETHPDYYKT